MHLHKTREVKYKFIYDNLFIFQVEKMCEILDIKRGSYYAWLNRTLSSKAEELY